MEAKWGTRAAPIIIEAAAGRGSVTLTAPMNIFDVRSALLQFTSLIITNSYLAVLEGLLWAEFC
jgi:hypothetical protein